MQKLLEDMSSKINNENLRLASDQTISDDIMNSVISAENSPPVQPEREPHDFKGFVNLWEHKANFKAEEWLVYNILEKNSLALLHGRYGSHKSFITIDLCASIAAGIPWHGHKVEQGSVFYIMGEGHNGIYKRAQGWAIRRKDDLNSNNIPFYVSNSSADFYDQKSIQMVINDIEKIINETNQHPQLIAIDTIHRNFTGDENSSKDIGLLIKNTEMLQKRFNCTVLAVHHPGKNAENGARGSSSLPSAADIEWAISYDDHIGITRFENRKMKEGNSGYKLAFSMDVVELGKEDSDGRMMTTLVPKRVDWDDSIMSSHTVSNKLGKNQQTALEILKSMFEQRRNTLAKSNNDPAGARVKLDDWRIEVQNSGINPQAFYKVKESLSEKRLIVFDMPFVKIPNMNL